MQGRGFYGLFVCVPPGPQRELDALGGKDARDTGEVVRDADVGPAGLRGENRTDTIGCAVAELKYENARRAKERASLLDEAWVNRDAGGPAEESGCRFVVADFTRERGGFVMGDVRRIAHNQIEET